MSKQAEDRKSILQRISERLAKANLSGGSFWKAKPGDNHIRILEGVGEMGLFWINVGQHFLSRTDVHVCPQFTIGKEERCPICEMVSELYTAGDDESKKIASRIRMSKSFWMNIIDRSNPDSGPQIYRAPKTVMDVVSVLITDPTYNNWEKDEFVFDSNSGRDVNVKRVGTGMTDTKYSVVPAAKDTPLHVDPARAQQWLDQAMDLTPVELTEDPSEDAQLTHDDQGHLVAPLAIEPYDRLKKVIEGASFDEAGGAEDEEDEDLPPFPDDSKEEPAKDEIDQKIATRRSAARTRRSRR